MTRQRTGIGRRISALCAGVSLLAAAGCGSSASTNTSPTAITRCAVTVSGNTNLAAEGGGGTLSVSAERECAWSATTDGQWLSIKSGASGQGGGTVEFTAAANPDPVTRQGAIVVNDRRLALTQAAGECVITLAAEEAAFGQSGGSGRVEVRASSQLCTWRAEPDVDWIVLRSDANGRGSTAVNFEVMPSTGSARSGSIRIAGRRFTVNQSAACAFSINPASAAAGAGGGSGTISVTAGPGCAWDAASQVNWISLSPGSGQGSRPVTFTVAPNAGAERSGTATIAGQTFRVTQAAAAAPGPGPVPPPPPPQNCSFEISPQSAQMPAAGGNGGVTVRTSSGCAWQTASNADWIRIVSGASGTGNGEVAYTVAPNTGVAARSGTLTIAGLTFTIQQAGASPQVCTYRVRPLTFEVSADERRESVNVEAGSLCPWTATSRVPWIRIESGAAGTGDGEVRFLIEENRSAAQRTGSLTVAGETVTITQRRK